MAYVDIKGPNGGKHVYNKSDQNLYKYTRTAKKIEYYQCTFLHCKGTVRFLNDNFAEGKILFLSNSTKYKKHRKY
jgi:hypothetical protein